MSKALFARFNKDRSEYERLVAFWNEVVWCSIPQPARSGWVAPWFATRPVALQNANPIFTAWSPQERRGVAVTQLAPKRQSNDFIAFRTDWFGGDDNPDAIMRLNITCVLTDRNWKRIAAVMQQWIEESEVVAGGHGGTMSTEQQTATCEHERLLRVDTVTCKDCGAQGVLSPNGDFAPTRGARAQIEALPWFPIGPDSSPMLFRDAVLAKLVSDASPPISPDALARVTALVEELRRLADEVYSGTIAGAAFGFCADKLAAALEPTKGRE